MEPTTTEKLRSAEEEQYQQYRTLSFAAIVALVFGVISIPTLVAVASNALILILPFVGIMIGLYAVMTLRNRQDEFTGFGSARIGLMLSTLVFVSGVLYSVYVYATEVPEGYQRISFSQLQPDPKHPELAYNPIAGDIDSKQVFVKGYVYPDDQLKGIKQFILVPDMGTCCFGGQPKLTDMIQVTLKDPLSVEYSMFLKRLGGKFQLGSANAHKVGRVIYHLDADYLK